jgi:colanic acid biosynthesis glycosyl transferase WcaI
MKKSVFFWSSVESPMFMGGLLRALRENGVSVEHRFAVSASAYRAARGPARRAILRCRMYLEFPIRLSWSCLWSGRSEVHVVTTNPFFAPWVALLSARRGSSVVHLVYDLYPGALIVGGRLREGAIGTRLIRRVVRQILDRATANVFLAEGLRRHAESVFGPIPRTWVIAVGSDANAFASHSPETLRAGTPIDVLYCGNLGAMHDVDTLLGAVRIVEGRRHSPELTLTFHASGSVYPSFKIRAMAISSRVRTWLRFDEPLADQTWVERMARAHVALVTMKAGAERIVMPSKVYSALAAGQAILAVCPRDSDLAELVLRYDCGWIVAPGCTDDLVRVLDEIASRPDVVQRKRENAFRAGQLDYCEAAIGKAWQTLFDTLV